MIDLLPSERANEERPPGDSGRKTLTTEKGSGTIFLSGCSDFARAKELAMFIVRVRNSGGSAQWLRFVLREYSDHKPLTGRKHALHAANRRFATRLRKSSEFCRVESPPAGIRAESEFARHFGPAKGVLR